MILIERLYCKRSRTIIGLTRLELDRISSHKIPKMLGELVQFSPVEKVISAVGSFDEPKAFVEPNNLPGHPTIFTNFITRLMWHWRLRQALDSQS